MTDQRSAEEQKPAEEQAEAENRYQEIKGERDLNAVFLQAHAKINLTLDVTGKRPDGYHEVRMIMQSLRLSDEVMVEKIPGQDAVEMYPLASEAGILEQEVPYDDTNLMMRAAKLMRKSCGLRDGVRMYLGKHIPAAAGLAGGSSDAAAVLRGINERFSLGLSREELCRIGVQIGADVPYCLTGGTAFAEGIGEILTPLSKAPHCFVLLIKPARGVSTAAIYKGLDGTDIPPAAHPDTTAALAALAKGSLPDLAAHMGNILEHVTVPMMPELAEIKKKMRENGALAAQMSGSGPTMFGLFETRADCERAAKKIRKELRSAGRYVVIATEFADPA